VNIAIRKLQHEKHNFKVQEKLVEFTTVLATRTLGAVPADWKEHNGKPWSVDFEGPRHKLAVAPDRGSIIPIFDDIEDGPPRAILIGEQSDIGAANFEMWPLPDGNSTYSDGEYRIVIPYFRILPALVNNGDTNWFTVNAEEYIVNRATAEAFAIDWDLEKLTFWKQLAATDLKDALDADNKLRIAGMTTLVPHWRGAREAELDI